MAEIWAIILAAGSARRMGTQKMLLPYGRSTILETTITNVLGSTIKNVMVVLGADQERILEVITPLPVEHCFNENHPDGMLSSVICGLNSIPAGYEAVVIFPGDQPEIPPEVTNKLINSFQETLQGIIIPVHRTRRGHPVLVDMKYHRLIEQLDPSQGLRSLMGLFPGDVRELEVDESGILLDIDNRTEYEAACTHHLKRQ